MHFDLAAYTLMYVIILGRLYMQHRKDMKVLNNSIIIFLERTEHILKDRTLKEFYETATQEEKEAFYAIIQEKADAEKEEKNGEKV